MLFFGFKTEIFVKFDIECALFTQNARKKNRCVISLLQLRPHAKHPAAARARSGRSFARRRCRRRCRCRHHRYRRRRHRLAERGAVRTLRSLATAAAMKKERQRRLAVTCDARAARVRRSLRFLRATRRAEASSRARRFALELPAF